MYPGTIQRQLLLNWLLTRSIPSNRVKAIQGCSSARCMFPLSPTLATRRTRHKTQAPWNRHPAIPVGCLHGAPVSSTSQTRVTCCPAVQWSKAFIPLSSCSYQVHSIHALLYAHVPGLEVGDSWHIPVVTTAFEAFRQALNLQGSQGPHEVSRATGGTPFITRCCFMLYLWHR